MRIRSNPSASRQQSATDPRADLARIIGGTAAGFGGILMILGAEKLLPSSSAQELIALCGLLLLGGGVIQTLRGYFALSILRIFRFFDDSSDYKTPRY